MSRRNHPKQRPQKSRGKHRLQGQFRSEAGQQVARAIGTATGQQRRAA